MRQDAVGLDLAGVQAKRYDQESARAPPSERREIERRGFARVLREIERREIARIWKQGQNAILISADEESAEQVQIDPDQRRWHHDETHVGGKIHLTRKHAEGDRLRRNPLASEIAGGRNSRTPSYFERGRASGRTGLTSN